MHLLCVYRDIPPAGHVGLGDDEASEEVKEGHHVGGTHRRNLQVGRQCNSNHACSRADITHRDLCTV